MDRTPEHKKFLELPSLKYDIMFMLETLYYVNVSNLAVFQFFKHYVMLMFQTLNYVNVVSIIHYVHFQ